jgi:ABC-type nickel/cobalt efflux system permease component RcnA
MFLPDNLTLPNWRFTVCSEIRIVLIYGLGYTHAHARTRARTHTRTHAHAHARTRARARTHAHPHAHTPAHPHTRTHARTRTHTQTHAPTSLAHSRYYHLRLVMVLLAGYDLKKCISVNIQTCRVSAPHYALYLQRKVW